MNERIRELAEQAGLSHMPSNYPDMADLYKGADFELEKFAELIVEECMWKIMQRKEEAIDNYWHVGEAMSAAISDISEHFGVEE